jgi:hypothetical protein
MGLIDRSTVIILGAGCSVPFGLPTGLELIEQVATELDSEALQLSYRYNQGYPTGNSHEDTPILYAWHCSGDFTQQVNFAPALDLLRKEAKWLRAQTSDTIDDLIRQNPTKQKLLKICIVYLLLKSTHSFNDQRWVPKNFATRIIERTPKKPSNVPISERNWVHQLVNLVRVEYLDDPDVLELKQKVQIISFNYDGILERVLDQVWSSSELISTQIAGSWRDLVEIHHPHGVIAIDDQPMFRQELPKYLFDRAEEIAVVNENESTLNPKVAEARSLARHMTIRARNIYALGFAFARNNCWLLGLDLQTSREVVSHSKSHYHFLNFDASSGLKDRVQRLVTWDQVDLPYDKYVEKVPHERTAGSGRFLSIPEALADGFLGEMPA